MHNEITFERCAHDRQNPYVMISKEMLQDPSISPKAKGVLAYLLSLPADWKIYHSQLQKALNVGEDYINSAMQELINNGYAERTREKIKGVFQPYKYKIREFKKCLPDRENRPGFSGPENPVLLNKHSPMETKETTTKQTSAAVSLLSSVEIPDTDKTWLVENYDEETIKHAVAFAKHPSTKITKTLSACIKWACENKPPIPKTVLEEKIENRRIAFEIKNKSNIPSGVFFEILNKHVEIGHSTSQKPVISIPYEEKGFKEQLENALQKHGIATEKNFLRLNL